MSRKLTSMPVIRFLGLLGLFDTTVVASCTRTGLYVAKYSKQHLMVVFATS